MRNITNILFYVTSYFKQEVKTTVNEQGERLDDLEEVVEETVDKVEELDHKV